MKAVVFDGPRSVSIQDRPVPQIQDEEDIIVKVSATALCGSELHVYRGHQASPTGFIMGHEFTGTVVAAGSAVKSVAVGDKIVAPFTASCSIGVHNAEIPWSGSEAYGKNIRLQMGRCPVRSIFSEALVLLEKKQHLLGFMFENIMPLSEAVQGYTLFDEMKVQKVVFKP
ncbi:hypothetical protein TrVFT333_006554 [Trichoderma virens FT-333]|nr:hypothetical protein TrVFT333_006554 [Trichoderma virens FT-333]